MYYENAFQTGNRTLLWNRAVLLKTDYQNGPGRNRRFRFWIVRADSDWRPVPPQSIEKKTKLNRIG